MVSGTLVYFLLDLATLAAWAIFFHWLARVNWTNLVILAKLRALCFKVPLICVIWLNKDVCAFRLVILGTAACILLLGLLWALRFLYLLGFLKLAVLTM